MLVAIVEIAMDGHRNERELRKTGRRSHHLPAAALDIVRAVPRLNKGNHVFAVDARGALTYRTVRHHFGEAAKRRSWPGCRTCGCTTFGARS